MTNLTSFLSDKFYAAMDESEKGEQGLRHWDLKGEDKELEGEMLEAVWRELFPCWIEN